MKLSIVIPVYYNEDNLIPLYEDIQKKIIQVIDYEYEIVMVNDGSKDNSYEVMQELSKKDKNIKIISLSRNFGSHAAILCGLSHCTGDCAVVKAADLQEPTELILDMVKSWKKGFKTDIVYYTRLAREVGSSKWTLRKKIRLVMDTLFSFSTLPISIVLSVGICSFLGAMIWAVVVIVFKLAGNISVSGWTTLFIFNLASFGIIMLTLGILGEYLWRTFDASRNRPPYIIENENNIGDSKDD